MPETDYQHLRTILPLIETQLVSEGVVPKSNQIVWAFVGQDVPTFNPPREIVFRIGEDSPREGDFFLGSGSTDRRAKRMLHVELRTRVQLDKSNDKIQLLTNATKGHLQFEDLVMDALDNWHPTAGDGGSIYELCPDAPLEWVGTTHPQEYPMSKDWSVSTMMFLVPYVKNVTRNGSES